MQPGVILVGLACGALLATIGLAAWDSFRPRPEISPAVLTVVWLAAGLLLAGAALSWWSDRALSLPASRLLLMAALAAPPSRRHLSSWERARRVFPALLLAGAGLLFSAGGTTGLPFALPALALVVCGGVGARALGDVLCSYRAGSSSAVAYALLTLLVGAMALVNLWQRGTIWGGASGAGALAGAWLAWSAARLAQRPRLQAGLTGAAALALVAVVLI